MAEKLSERVAFEPFGTLAGVLRGEPVKIMPVGKFYRDNRVLDITEADLQEIERNVAAGLPRFRIPINENHQANGKVGTVKAVKYMADGPDGKGLYASLDLTDEGKAALQARRWDAVSPEMIWKKNGATYQDPQTGKRHDSVLVGLALCDKPYFGHDNVALFTATPPTETDTMADDTAKPRRGNGYTKLREMMRAKFDELMAMVRDEDGDGVPDGEAPEMPMPAEMDKKHEGMSAAPQMGGPLKAGQRYIVGSPIPIHFRTSETSGVVLPAEMEKKHEGMSADTAPVAGVTADKPAADAAVQGAETMADNDQTPATPPAPEQMTQVVSVEEFAAVKAQLEAEQKARAEIAERLTAAERRTRLAGWAAKVENFHAVPTDGLVDKFMALEDAAPDLAEFFAQTIAALDTKIVTGDLFTQRGSARKATANVETLADLAAQIHVEKFDGAPDKYALALDEAGRKRPDLLAAYLRSAPVDKE